jgi:hypothetical protein
MNQDWREKRIRQLFRELGREDERNAPGFAGVVNAALLGGRGTGRRLRLWRLAPLAAAPVLAIIVALLLLRSPSTETASPEGGSSSLVLPNRETGPRIIMPAPIVIPSPEGAIITRGRRPRRAALPARNSSLLISQWRSPTDYLLRVPGNELLKSIPRVPDSTPDITRSLIEKHN